MNIYKIPDVPEMEFRKMFNKFNPRLYHAVSRINNGVDLRLSELENTNIWGIANL